MKVALIGYGKMGRVVEELARERDVEVVERFTGEHPLQADEAARRALAGVTALIDFSVPQAVRRTVETAAELSANLVIGTSGWHEDMDDVRQVVEDSGIGAVQAWNFSLGINFFYRIVEQGAKFFSAATSYDPYIYDWHHRFKQDSPSGTALELRRRMAHYYKQRDLPITSQRAGYVPSIHAVGFDSMADTIHLEHRARNRRGFAEGALLAAQWIAGRQGFYEFQEVLDDLYPGS